MQTIVWKAELNTGIEEIDNDHQYLIDLTNQLIDAINKDIPKSNILKIFDKLESYTIYHFEREERYMNDHAHLKETRKYIKHHKAQHRYFIEKLSELKMTLSEATQKSITYDIVEFLLHWLLDHIIKEDLRLAQFIEKDKQFVTKQLPLQRIILWLKEKTTLQQRFLLIFSVPLLFLIVQSSLVSYKAYSQYQERAKLQEVTQSMINIDNSITQLQRERGLSSAYIASHYQHFQKELQKQRRLTDHAIHHNFSAKKTVEKYLDIRQSMHFLQQLQQIRQNIDKHLYSSVQSITYYTKFINTLIDMIKKLSYLPFNTIDAHTYNSLLLLIHLNEIHGLIRKEGVTCLETGKQQCKTLYDLYNKKETYEHALTFIAPPELIEKIQNIQKISEMQNIMQIKKQLLTKDIQGHSAAQAWFKQTSVWIDQYNSIITEQLQQINQNALKEKEAFSTIIQHIWIIFIFMLLFIAVSLYLLKESIIKPLKNLTRALHKLSKGDKNIFFHVTSYKDAISYMEHAYNQLRNSLIKADYANILMYLQQMKTQKYVKLSEEDPLTGIFNRRVFIRILQQQIDTFHYKSKPFTLLILDIDHFKKINDTYGHDVGDNLLQYFTDTIKHKIRKNDIFARIGGEEFALLLPNTAKEDACKVAKNISSAIRSLYIADLTPPLTITVSIGVASYTIGMSEKDLFQKADEKLYQAKDLGRDQVNC